MEPELDTVVLEEAQEMVELEVDAPVEEAPVILAELVIEEVSIDGMCGVY